VVKIESFINHSFIFLDAIDFLMREVKGVNMDNHQAALDACRKEEQAYWAMHDELLKTHCGKWVVVAHGQVIAVSDDPLRAAHESSKKGYKYSYFNRVGFEDKTEFKIRRITFPYDTSYSPFPIPKASARVHNINLSASKDLIDLILDTGADVTCLREQDCEESRLEEGGISLHQVRAYGGQSKPALFYNGNIEIDNKRYPALIQMVDNTDERILGRDVLNQLTTRPLRFCL
jgi:predicted aspartyl protease